MVKNNKSAVSGALVMTVMLIFLVRIVASAIQLSLTASPINSLQTVDMVNTCTTMFTFFVMAVWFLFVRLYSVRVTHHSSLDFLTAFVIFITGLQAIVSIVFAIFFFKYANAKVNPTDMEMAIWMHSIVDIFVWMSICSVFFFIYLYRKAIGNNTKIRSNIYFLYFIMVLEIPVLIYSIKTAYQAQSFLMIPLSAELLSWLFLDLFLFQYMRKDFKLREHRHHHHHHHDHTEYTYLRAAEPKREINPELGKYETHTGYVRMEVEDVERKMNPNLGTYEEHKHHHHHHHHHHHDEK